MNCDELLEILNQYIEGGVDPAICREFESHLAGCHPCRVVVDNVRKTIVLYKKDEPYPMPEAFHRRLHEELRRRWREKFGKAT